ncbi:pitrilysin family protein [Prochlorococcus sp. MIT 1307]|uniref:M16 family metallopeptidase n=1 Tax=Prochlorococcus sp. MIT 1307 TaxID=3096219 RepID=UPI002A75CCB7|nr:pitrilysin family protein [Prochlorococcus sp. MIT 1307]
MKEAPLTCLDLWFKAGSSNEWPGEEGIAHFLEHMVFKGSNNNDAGEFDRKIEALGGSSNAATGFDDVHFHVLVPPKVVAPALDLLLDLVLQPALLPSAYAMEREVVLEEIAQQNDQPDEKAFQKLLSTCWCDHSYGRPILGYKKSLKQSTPEQMRSFHRRLYTAENCCLSIAGALPQNIDKLIEKSLLSQLEKSSKPDLATKTSTNIPFQKLRQEFEVPRLESSRLLMAWPIAPAKEQKIIMGADIATSLLAEGRCSRLVKHLREDLQIVETIDMDVTSLEKGGLILLEACCREENLDRVEEEIHKILGESINSFPKKHELDRACHLVRNGHCFNLEATSQVAALAGAQTLWERPQGLLEPLEYIDYWSGSKLKDEIFCQLKPELSCTLIAKPSEVES